MTDAVRGLPRSGAAMLVAVLALAPCAPARAQENAPEVLTLEEAVALALQSNRRVAVAQMRVEQAERKLESARTRRLPSMELEAQAGTTLNPIEVTFPQGAFGNFPATGPIPSTDTVVEAPRAVSGTVSATLAQPITQLHRIGLNTKLSALARDAEREKLREERTAVAAEVRRLYYGLLQTGSILRAREDQVRVYRELDRVVGEQVAIQVALRSDGLDVKARLANEEYELTRLRDELATSKERMNQLLGRELSHEFAVAPVAEASLEEVDLAAATARALERRPDLAQARLAVEQAETDRRVTKAGSIPDLSLALTYYSFVNIDLLPRNIAQVGLQLKWEPFDWGRRGKERAQKDLQTELARSTARDAEDRARIEVAQQFRSLQQARLLIEAQRLAREAAQERMRVAMTRHRHEAALLKDVLQSEADLSSAQMQYERALLTYWTARADFRKALGEEQ